ncbi:MAG: hypothetical protein ACRDRI_19180 [Pseudonocardiaceae bacterium]
MHLRTAVGELTTASYTSDADLGVDPEVLDDKPLLEQTMTAAGFTQGPNPGHWHRPEKIGDRIEEVVVDLMVADTFSGPGSRRSGVIPPHSRDATRRTPGLEPAAVDHDVMAVPSLEPERDGRVLDVRVAGVAALWAAVQVNRRCSCEVADGLPARCGRRRPPTDRTPKAPPLVALSHDAGIHQ